MKKINLTMSQLKLIAIITMLIDHIGAVLIEPLIIDINQFKDPLVILYWFLRLIGRLSFPLFAFGIAQGLKHTHSKMKYGLRMAIFAIISEPFFDLAASHTWIDFSYQNVMITFLISIMTVSLFDFYKSTNLLNWLILGLGVLLSELCQCDYGWMGVLMVFCFYYFPDNSLLQDVSTLFLMSLQFTAPLSLLLIKRYNQQKGTAHKYFYYLFYPLHLFILYLIYKNFIISTL